MAGCTRCFWRFLFEGRWEQVMDSPEIWWEVSAVRMIWGQYIRRGRDEYTMFLIFVYEMLARVCLAGACLENSEYIVYEKLKNGVRRWFTGRLKPGQHRCGCMDCLSNKKNDKVKSRSVLVWHRGWAFFAVYGYFPDLPVIDFVRWFCRMYINLWCIYEKIPGVKSTEHSGIRGVKRPFDPNIMRRYMDWI